MDQQMYMLMYLSNSSNAKHFGNVYPSNQADASLTSPPARPNSKSKICLVCGDISKSNHFGALCCCSCKAFFRRSVQNESYKNFHCPYNSNCEITILSRKCCQFCRFEKCVRIGMEISWVMSEEERLQLLKSRMLKKQKKEQEQTTQAAVHSGSSKDSDSFMDSSSQNSRNSDSGNADSYFADYSLIGSYLTGSEINQIEILVNDYLQCCVQIQPNFIQASFRNGQEDEARLAENDEEIVQLFLNCVYQFANFSKRCLPIFKFLKLSDQQILLRSGIIELCFLRAAFCFKHGMFYRTILKQNSRFSNGVQPIGQQSLQFDLPGCDQFSQESDDQFGRLNGKQFDAQLNHDFDPNQFNHKNDLPTSQFQFASSNGVRPKEQSERQEPTANFEYRFGKAPVLAKHSLESFLGEQLSNKFFSFVKQIQECNLDEAMVLLVALVVLLNPERNQLISCKQITGEQEAYLDLLERYMQWKFGSSLSGTLFARLLINLTNLRELGELFAEFQLENNVLDRFGGRFEQTDCSDHPDIDQDAGLAKRLLSKIFTIKSLTD